MSTEGVIRISPFEFVHVLDLNSNVTRLEKGPQSLVLQTNERLTAGPLPLVVVPPGQYCVVKDPMKNYIHGKTCDLRLGELEIKFHGVPFALYPGENLVGVTLDPQSKPRPDLYSKAIKALPVIKPNHGLRLRARFDHLDEEVPRCAGDIWQLEGPLTYYPTPQAEILSHVPPVVILTGQSLKLRALQDCCDSHGNPRVTGEEWIVRRVGAYLPGVYEEVVAVEKATVLTDETALHLRATQTLTDSLNHVRIAGDEWLITNKNTEVYYPQIGVEVICHVQRTVLSRGQYCVVLDPIDKKGRPQLGKRELRKGLATFFLHPGERLLSGVENCHLLSENEAVVVQALDAITDTSEDVKIDREPGDRWMIRGPCEYIPPIEVNIIDKREKIPLSENEGVYVRDVQTGAVRAVHGPDSYMLTEFEELWEKPLSDLVEQLLRQGGGIGSEDIRKVAYFEQSIDPGILQGRNKSRVVTYRCPGNTAVQVYNYQQKSARVVFGPELVILGPHENFSVLSLSAGKPKKPNALKSICLMLGPDFISDIIEVETSDHARLRLQIAFNNHFEFTRGKKESELAIFAIPDFIGFACRQIGSCIRASVAQVTFDEFHRHSSDIIHSAVFGNPPKPQLRFDVNNMVVTSIDIQSIEPVDLKMRDSLMKSVQMAIEIATNSIEAAATHEAKRMEQAARGKLERQKLANEKEAEKARITLCELRAVTSAVESTGQAKAEAQAEAEKTRIECTSEIEAAKLKAQAEEIQHYSQLEIQDLTRSSELSYRKEMNDLEVEKCRELSCIEVKKFSDIVDTLGADTISAIATSGPEMEVQMLKSLGLESVLLTDGNSPINLFNTAQGLLGKTK
ncbi:major vault protein-like [Liolophura sinensis]|uniref:major vault protein-like n=1 Tax=Liolophura sinensis TaxID=3198878 RepID=UPI0031597029